MNRRQALRLGAGVLPAFLAGCTTGGPAEPTSTPPPATVASELKTVAESPTDGGGPTTPRAYRDAFAAFLDEKGIEVLALESDPSARVTSLGYVSRKSGYNEIGAQVGSIAGGFFRQVSLGWDMKRLDATMHDPSESPVATWHAKTEWFREFQRQEIAAEELSLRVLETLEPVEG